MKPSLLVLTSDGDMDLILRHPNRGCTPEVQQTTKPSDEDANEANNSDKTGMGEDETENMVEFKDITSLIRTREDLSKLHPVNEQGQSVELRYCVSSAHLMLASPVFKAMLNGPFLESHRNENGRLEIRTSEWCAEALLILLDIIHGHHRSVQKTMALDLLKQMATLVDYYKCDEIVELFAQSWVASAIKEDEITGSSSETNMSRLLICWVFGQASLFDSLVRTIVRSSEGPVQTDLPLPDIILKSLEKRRRCLANHFLNQLYALVDKLWSDESSCTKNCAALMLGLLLKEMRSIGLEIPRSESGASGQLSFLQLQDFVSKLEKIQLGANYCRIGSYGAIKCSFKQETAPWLQEVSVVDVCGGISFKSFQSGLPRHWVKVGRFSQW